MNHLHSKLREEYGNITLPLTKAQGPTLFQESGEETVGIAELAQNNDREQLDQVKVTKKDVDRRKRMKELFNLGLRSFYQKLLKKTI